MTPTTVLAEREREREREGEREREEEREIGLFRIQGIVAFGIWGKCNEVECIIEGIVFSPRK